MNWFPLFVILLAVVLPLVAIWAWQRSDEQRAWARVPGRVARSRVEIQGEDYRADVEYAYRYQERDYRGTTVRSLQPAYNWRGPAERICQRYPVGAIIEVYVSPQDPHQSVLEPGGGSWLVPVSLIASLGLVIAAFAMGR
jgi:Protein of unknown function (DUF3592)